MANTYQIGAGIDYATQQADLERQRQLILAQMLAAQRGDDGQTVAGVVPQRSPLEYLVRGLTVGLGAYQNRQLTEQQQDLVQQQKAAQADALSNLMQATGGNVDPQAFARAYSQASAAGLDPAMSAAVSKPYLTQRLLGSILGGQLPAGGAGPGAGGAAPGAAGAPTLGAGGGIGAVNPAAFALTVSGDPALEKAGALVAKANDLQVGANGTITQGGALVGRTTDQGMILYQGGDPTKPQFFKNPAELNAALADQAGAMESAKARAAAGYQLTLQPSVNPDGSPGPSRQISVQRAIEGAPAASGAAAAGGTAPAFEVNLQGKFTADQLRQIASDYERAAGSGFGVQASPQATKAAEGKAAAQTAQDTKVGEGFGGDYLSLVQAERAAPAAIGKYSMLRDYLGNVSTSKIAPVTQALKAYARGVLPDDVTKGWTADVPFAQAAQSLSREMALQLRNPAGGAGMPGAMSDSDRAYLESMTPGWANDPQAIPLMIDARIAIERRNQEMGRLAREYRQKNGAIDEGFYQQAADFANRNPLFGAQGEPGPRAAGTIRQGGAPAPVDVTKMSDQDLLNFLRRGRQ